MSGPKYLTYFSKICSVLTLRAQKPNFNRNCAMLSALTHFWPVLHFSANQMVSIWNATLGLNKLRRYTRTERLLVRTTIGAPPGIGMQPCYEALMELRVEIKITRSNWHQVRDSLFDSDSKVAVRERSR